MKNGSNFSRGLVPRIFFMHPSFSTIDVRGLEAPEPMLHVLSALEVLPNGKSLEVRIDREPHPLYRILERDGFAHAFQAGEDGFLLTIWHAD